ncbi:MAG: DNA translocase FtsK 4TM domain-containing protein, partial [Muribaculaceae bacterium]|nr:DNA translocase FtsK 4TM domain-containing protein [Muribaculaceae bacterium]
MKPTNDQYTGLYDPATLYNQPPIPTPDPAPDPKDNKKEATGKTSKRSKKNSEKESRPARKHKPLISPRVTLLTGIILVITALYTLIAALSFYIYAETDQSKIIGNTVMELAQGPYKVDNPTGPVGAYISHMLMTEWLGLGSFFLIFYIGAIGCTLLKLTKVRFWPLTFKCLILAITTSVVVGFATINYDGIIHWGGLHGLYVNKFLLATTGLWGTLGVSVILVALIVIIYLTQLNHLYIIWRRRVETRRQRQLELEEQRRATEAQIQDTLKTTVPDAEAATSPVPPVPSNDVVVGFDADDPHQSDVTPQPEEETAGPDDIDDAEPE